MKKKPSALFAMCIFLCVIRTFAQQGNQASQGKFSLGPDKLKALQNSVNLVTGQVAFPMELCALPGRGGLNSMVDIQYNSAGVVDATKINNEFSPTSILGLGWSFDIPRIVADHKQTGTRHDDDFFLIENGISNQLFCTSFSTSPRVFSTQKFNAWKVEYYADLEKWIITRENGFKYSFTAVQWMVKWDNWVGNSSLTENQSRLAYVWALTEVQNLWGDKLTFQYSLVEEPVGEGGLNHTKAFYLSKIVDPVGQSVEFIYAAKQEFEYLDVTEDHVVPENKRTVEPDSFQEKYETLYISNVVTRSNKNNILYTIDLGYSLKGSGQLSKRYLTSIQKRFPSGETQPAVQFQYFDSGINQGLLRKVINSLGAHIEYYYKSISVPSSTLISSAIEGTNTLPKIFASGDYTIVTFRANSVSANDATLQPVKVYACYWDGAWSQELMWDVPPMLRSDYEQLDIALTAKHFVIRFYQSKINRHYVYVARKKTFASSQPDLISTASIWEKSQREFVKVGENFGNVTGRVFAGENFAGFVNRFAGSFHVWTWRDGWEESDLSINDTSHENFLTAGNNFIFLHNDARANHDQLHFYYLDAEKIWRPRTLPNSVEFNSDGGSDPDSHWYAANSFVLGLVNQNPEYIYQWDENYENFVKVDVLGRYQDASRVFISNAGQIGISQTDKGKGIAASYDGKDWHTMTYSYDTYKETSYSDAVVLRSQRDEFRASGSNGVGLYWDPYWPRWETNAQDFGDVVKGFTKLNDQYGNAIQAGTDLAMINNKLHVQMWNDNWAFIGNIPLEATDYLIGSTAMVLDPNYLVYEYSTTKSGKPAGTYIVFLENYQIKGYKRFGNLVMDPSRTNASITTLALKYVSGSSGVDIHRMIDDKFRATDQSTIVVSSTMWSDGNNAIKTTYEYARGKMIAKGIAQFNIVTVIPGGDLINAPGGYTEYCFYNGMKETILNVTPPVAHNNYENLFAGLPYQIITKNSNGQQTSFVKSYYEVFTKPILNSLSQLIDNSQTVRLVKTEQYINDGNFSSKPFSTVENEYDPVTLLLRSTRQVNSTGPSTSEEMTVSYTYWWQKYDTDMLKNILSPVVLSKTVNTKAGVGTHTASAVSTWTYNSTLNKYFPYAAYTWKQHGDPETFPWAGEGSDSDWLLTSKISALDPADGTVYETEMNDGTKQAMIFNADHTLPIAQAKFASYDQIAYTSFEDGNTGNWTYDNALVTGAEAEAGSKCLHVSTTGTYVTKTVPAGTYELSYWYKGPHSVTDVENGTIQSNVEEVKNGWTLTKSIVTITSSTGVIKVNISSDGFLDEVRLKPRGAEMTTFIYNDDGNVLVKVDTNLVETRFEYDTQYRLVLVRDHQGNIVKKYTYHYRDQQ
jgi:YD repeat-containing protein